jgi:hypothetical protein
MHVGRRVRIRRSDFDRLVEAGYSRAEPTLAIGRPTIWDGVVAAPEVP